MFLSYPSQVNLKSCGLHYLRQCICLELWRAIPEEVLIRVGFLRRDSSSVKPEGKANA